MVRPCVRASAALVAFSVGPCFQNDARGVDSRHDPERQRVAVRSRSPRHMCKSNSSHLSASRSSDTFNLNLPNNECGFESKGRPW